MPYLHNDPIREILWTLFLIWGNRIKEILRNLLKVTDLVSREVFKQESPRWFLKRRTKKKKKKEEHRGVTSPLPNCGIWAAMDKCICVQNREARHRHMDMWESAYDGGSIPNQWGRMGYSICGSGIGTILCTEWNWSLTSYHLHK